MFAAGTVWAIAASGGGSTLYGINPAAGAVRLQFGFGAEQNQFATPAVGDNVVFVASTTQLLGFAPN
ncbi:MAG TPA: hypothetical protein VMQ40_04060 [Acidimicrobiales bacterium]|nr:hypothetical protein [Acidimicrobiales bacterium]